MRLIENVESIFGGYSLVPYGVSTRQGEKKLRPVRSIVQNLC